MDLVEDWLIDPTRILIFSRYCETGFEIAAIKRLAKLSKTSFLGYRLDS